MPETIRIPLLHDHHTHPLLYAAFSQAVSLESVESKTAANKLINEAGQDPGTPIVVAHGWRSNRFEWSATELEQLPPVAIFNVSLHGLEMNAGGTRFVREKYGAQVDKITDQDWYEDHFRMVLNWFANLYASAAALNRFYEHLLQLGVYSAEEMLLFDENEIQIFRESGLLDRTRFWAAPDTFETLSAGAKEQVYGLKLFTDGALGARTAGMKRPFLGDPIPGQSPNTGKLIYDHESLDQTVGDCLATGKALAVHAIGDRAIEQLVGIFEGHTERINQVPEVRIEHAQMVDRQVAERVKHLGVKLSMQPNFNADSVDYRDRIDAGYCEMNNPFRMLIDDVGFEPGKDLVFGSDGMPHGIEFAIKQSLFPSLDSQRLTTDEFQAGYCLDNFDRGHIDVEFDGREIAGFNVSVA